MTMPFQRKQILLVEDNAEVRQFLASALEYEKYTVYQAANGQAGLKMLEQIIPDLIISDINMPRMNGMEFYKALRENPAWTPIPFLFLTSSDAPEAIQIGRELGVEDYLTKPIDSKDLLAIVNARLMRAAEVQAAQVGMAYLETVNVLSNVIEERDPYTRGHVERVATYARRMAEVLQWTPDMLRMLDFGARLHDIGKIIVPDHVLKKASPLVEAEWDLMKQHPEAGAKILRPIRHLQGTIPYVRYHHERWNGSGYPYGLAGKEIPIQGRLLAVVDVFDALTTVRPYHPAHPVQEVVRYLQMKANVLFDPKMVTVFVQVLKSGGQVQAGGDGDRPLTAVAGGLP